MNKTLKALLAAFAAMLFAVSANAQVTTSSIAGKVVDSEGPVVGAAVVATYTASGNTFYALTNKDGQYRINNVTAGGPYTITVEMLGYSKLTITGIEAPLAETVVVDAALQDDAVALEGVVISADAAESGMNIRRSGVGTSISRNTMENVPTVGRSLNDVMKLTPQGSTTTSGFAVGGGNYRGSTVTVDGAAFNNAFGIGSNLPAGGSPISIDALEQISVNVTPFDVRQSGFQGGAINATTKQGTNEFHASVYNYYTSHLLRGDKIGDNDVTNTDALANTTGITVGGPIIKNKLFFFVNAEYSLDDVPGSSYVARESDSTPWTLKDAGNVNRPTVAQMDEMKKYVGDKFGYDPGRYQGYSLSTPDYKVLARIDWNINETNKLNVRFSHTHNYYSSAPSSSMSPIGGTNSTFGALKFNRYSAGRQAQYALPYEAARYYQEQNFTSVAAELNSRLMDGKANNMVRVAWSHQDEPRSYEGSFFPTVDILSADKVTVNATDNTAILTTIGVDPFTYGNLRDVQTVTATDEFTYATGKHNIIAGAQLEWNRAINGFMQGGAGWYIYESWDAFKKDVESPSATTGPAAFMITHANLEDPTSQAFPAFDYTQASLYAQDEITFSDYFKLTAGLRLEMPFITIPTDNLNKDFASIASKNSSSSFAGLSTADVPNPTINVSPRIGFNWDVLKNRNLIVRGGTGIYTGRIPNVWLVSAIGNSNCLQYQYINKDVMKGGTNSAGIHFHQDRAEVINQLYTSNPFKKQDLTAPTATTILSKELKMPSSWKTSVAVDAKLPGGIKATLEGLYSMNFNEVYATYLGYKKDADGVQLPGEPAKRGHWSSEGINNSEGRAVTGYKVQNINNLHGKYYSVTAQLQKDFNFGLSLMAAYTKSGSTSLSDGNGDQISEFVNTYNVNGCNEPELGYSAYVTPNRLIANVSYRIAEGSKTATKIGLFYEGYNIGYISSYSYSRVSYLMNNQSGAGTASQLIYIPTDSEIDKMNFANLKNDTEKDAKGNAYTYWEVDNSQRDAYKAFLGSDKYTKNHRGEYAERNGVKAPWMNRFNLKLAQEFNFNVCGKVNTMEVGVDINNVGNLINSKWGTFQQLSSNTILSYQANNAKAGVAKESYYTFTAPTWKTYNNLASTWQMLVSVRYKF